MRLFFLSLAFIAVILRLNAQNVTITPTGVTPSFNYPRLTYDAILALSGPIEGDLAYDLTFKCLRVYNGSKWVCTISNASDFNPNITSIASAGGNGYDIGQSVAVDNVGNVYITGQFEGTAAFGNISVTSAGGIGVFIAKYNRDGQVQWVKSAGGWGNGFGLGIAVDTSSNVYITGIYHITISFENTTLTSAGNSDLYIAKYNTNGILQWVRSAGGPNSDLANSIAVDAAGNAYITGYFQGTSTFGTASITATPLPYDDVFIAKYTTNGTFQWVKSAGGSSNDFGYDIAADSNGNVYVTGSYFGTAFFDGTPITSEGSNDVFLAKYNTNGGKEWVRSAGGTGTENGQGVAVDGNGNVYISGNFNTTVRFDNRYVTSKGNNDIFIAKYTTDGTNLWLRSAGGINNENGREIAVDAIGSVYLTGYYNTSAMFGGSSLVSAGYNDLYVAKYSTNGDFEWATSAGGANDDYGQGIAIDASGNVFVVGNFELKGVYGNKTITSAGSYDTVVARIEKF
ncbi:SBBP repeat-containing protein [Runella salmonicolor]|uniref:SBBP repeat-containing protein n=1 Tax=Runella salmonicolor TaxID=2950278 RepID=A0ABT1FJM4_9BACT|nr:SBBP repeat-containing protein [Runella salmonicolor]MCP1381951.1 SBBP repeat-containing protein [Runella salmonicolor]